MSEFDLVVRNGTVVTASDTWVCDVGAKDGQDYGSWKLIVRRDRNRRRDGQVRPAGRHRRACTYRTGFTGDGRQARNRFLYDDRLRRLRRDHYSHPLRAADQRRIASRSGRGIPPKADRQGGDRLCHPPHRRRSYGPGSGSGGPRADRRRLHLGQGLHDVQGPDAERLRDSGGDVGCPAARRHDDDPRRERGTASCG